MRARAPTVEDLAADAFAYLPGLDVELEERSGCVLRNDPVNPHPLLGLVLRQRLAPESVADAVAEARDWFRKRGRTDFTWAVADTATPADLADRLCAHGLRPDDRDPLYAGMVLDEEPPGTPGIEVRRVEMFEDNVAADEVTWDSFGLTEEQKALARKGMRERWERVKDDPRGDTFVALLDGRVVGSAGASYTDVAVYLGGGNVAEAARGRGVYRALVRARWDAAVARGTPALVVQAGQMSRPILERLGFRTVCTIRALVDAAAL